MKLPRLLLVALVPAAFLAPVTTVHASPLLEIGDTVDVFFKGELATRYESNVFLREDDEDGDFVQTFTPGFEIVAGSGDARLTINLREKIQYYFDNDDLSHASDLVDIEGTYDSGGQVVLSTFLRYEELDQNTSDLQRDASLISRRNYRLGFKSDWEISPRRSLVTAIRVFRTDYRNFKQVYQDRDMYSLPVTFLYEYTEKLDLGLGYRFRFTDMHAAFTPGPDTPDRKDHFLNLVATGVFTEKLTGEIRLGYNMRDINGESANHNFGMDTSLKWALTEKLLWRMSLSRDFDTIGDGQSKTLTRFNTGMTYNITEKLSATGQLGYSFSNFEDFPGTNRGGDREDQLFLAGLGLVYAPNPYWQFGANYNFTTNDSNRTGSDFDNHVVNLSAQVTY